MKRYRVTEFPLMQAEGSLATKALVFKDSVRFAQARRAQRQNQTGAISSTIQQHQKAIQVTTYTNVQQHLKQMYIFCEQFFLCFRLVYLNCSSFHTQVYEEGSKYRGSPRIDENIRQGPLKGSPVAFNMRGPSKGSPMAFKIVSEITNARRLSPRFAGQERHGKTKVTSELCFFNSTHKQFYGRIG